MIGVKDKGIRKLVTTTGVELMDMGLKIRVP